MPEATPSFKRRLLLDESRGEYRDGDVRYVMLRADVLMGLFSRLEPTARSIALGALKDAVAESGGKSVATYFERTGRNAGQLLQVLEETASQLGWGAWRFDARAEALTLQVTNSPFAHAAAESAGPVCHAIQGILENTGRLVLDAAVAVKEIRCAASHGGETCTFHAIRS